MSQVFALHPTSSTEVVNASRDEYAPLSTGMTLCYRSHGNASAPAVILIAGLGLQLHYWPQTLLEGLVEQGFRVITLDNRDVGHSSRHDSPPVTLKDLIFNRGNPAGYTVTDMAHDVAALMDHLGIESAHVAGMSMGGMITQELAAHHPNRVLTMTSIFSTTGSRRVGQPSLKGKLTVIRKRSREKAEAIRNYIDTSHFIAGGRFHIDDTVLADYADKAWERGGGRKSVLGVSRQIGAILNSGDRTAHLGRINAPALVIHGDRDPLVNVSGGYATADAIRGARLVLIPGMGHLITDDVSPLLLDLLTGHFRRAA
ncbi:MAG: alpha/beta fold hydrolase [Limnobacter sp.]|uniref:alpha/beta fold hydrolase n=1 Tax=Limnobacter sp. TaxID=2003368 RepID=UPI00391B9DD4